MWAEVVLFFWYFFFGYQKNWGQVFQGVHSVTSYMPYKKHIYWLKITLFSDASDVTNSFDWLKITLFSDVIDVVEALSSETSYHRTSLTVTHIPRQICLPCSCSPSY